MPDYTYTYTAAELQQHHDRVSAVTGDLIGSDNLGDYAVIENRFKGNQNFNVGGSTGDPLPSGTPTTYNVGVEIAAGIEVITTNAEQITYVSGVLNSGNNTGIVRRRYPQDPSLSINKNDEYGGIVLASGDQLQAQVDDIATNGVRITEDAGDVVVDVDLSHANLINGFKFHGLSAERGQWADISNEDSFIFQTGAKGFQLSGDGYQIFESGLILQWGNIDMAAGSGTISYSIPFPNTVFSITSSTSDSNNTNGQMSVDPISLSQFDWIRGGNASTEGKYIAIGD